MLSISILLLAIMSARVQYVYCRMYNTSEIKELYDKFLIKYPRDFDTDEIGYLGRLELFQENIYEVEKLNNESRTARFEINMFSDWSDAEFEAFTSPLVKEETRYIFRSYGTNDWTHFPPNNLSFIAFWDWREKGAVSAVKKQVWRCNSCYAHAIAALIESLYAMKYQKNISISQYEILDCDYNSNGCINGNVAKALQRGKHLGFTLMKNYPSLWQNDYFCPKYGEIFVKKLYLIEPEPSVMAWFVSNISPVVLHLAFPKEYKAYKTGIIIGSEECSTMQPNHAVELIGYGVECGMKYWLLKNSWGEEWGDRGFFKMARGINACQIETHVVSASL